MYIGIRPLQNSWLEWIIISRLKDVQESQDDATYTLYIFFFGASNWYYILAYCHFYETALTVRNVSETFLKRFKSKHQTFLKRF